MNCSENVPYKLFCQYWSLKGLLLPKGISLFLDGFKYLIEEHQETH